jgi:carbon-monoxide dehydrogenase large subunit
MHGVGEMETIASTPAILNAVNDALSRMGAAEIDAPVTTEKIWSACRSV